MIGTDRKPSGDGVQMIIRSYRFVFALPFVQLLVACSPVTAPAKSDVAPAIESPVPASTPTISPAPTPGQDLSAAEAPVKPASDRGKIDERLLRPRLLIGDDVRGSLPDALPAGAKVSYVVVDLERGTTIARHHADRAHIPASSAKLATAVAALELLGPDHRFRTELRATGPVKDGVLKGDLILKGGGDPRLDIPDLVALIDELAHRPIRRIEGRFLIDDTLLPRFAEIEPSQPTEAAYNPGLGALSLAFNRVKLRWHNRDALATETVPRLDEASFEGRARKLLPPGGVQLKRFDGRNTVWQLADRGARRSGRSLPVKDAGLHAGRVFADLARLHGIDLPEPERMERHRTNSLLAVHESQPLHVLVRDMLWYSNNLVAELIGLAAATSVQPELGSLEESADIILSALKKKLPGTSWNGARLDNHSGLSSDARLTPEQLAAILRHGWNERTLSTTLPASGWSGTLARRFDRPDQAFRIWAKTGSMNYVTTLGGYMLSPSHGPAAFVVMISDENARAAYDAAPRRTREGEKKAHAWRDDAEDAMNDIVERWLEPTVTRPDKGLYVQSQG